MGGLKSYSESKLDAHVRKRTDDGFQRFGKIRQMRRYERVRATQEQEEHGEGDPIFSLLPPDFL
jgi:hypothetical protein